MEGKQFDQVLIDVIKAHITEFHLPPPAVIHASWVKMKEILMKNSMHVSIEITNHSEYSI
ncbi:hypothetical protein GK047_24385 [Paenibacillus sp. SYP-B3998]|uniref:Uncharacterized protein n=1 Tax=Paenibacillus sp. SYP-B3998 TaxID=2678564 RepID=A0A6G4A4A5_9BACL|nr:hypothetical protein [Paenibacillus sp. SYP-B3998]NEW09118.1 hypothetical protein [Paenibacillus sp. SYP-B3998]